MAPTDQPSQDPVAASAGQTAWPDPTARSLRQFLATESGSAGLLLAATIVALVWANSPLKGAYADVWSAHLTIDLAGARIDEDLRHWIDDGLMALFFFVIGLEIRRELGIGELRDRRAAAVPAIAALAGMVVPALIYASVNAGGAGAHGWGIVMATDIAFVLGALALLGPRIPAGVRLFLLTLAIVDDIGAIVVIAVVYTSGIDLAALAAAAGILVAIALARRLWEWNGPTYFVAGLALWVATLESGVHPTIAGVVLGAMVAAHPPRRTDIERAASFARVFRRAPTAARGRAATLEVSRTVSPNERFQEALHPFTSYLVIPLFALANAGVPLTGDTLSHALRSPITLGVIAGLVLGKALGVWVATAAAVALRVGPLPAGFERRHLPGASALAGIGFTVSLFIAELAFDDERLRDEAKVGVLVASVLAASVGWGLLRRARTRSPAADAAQPPRLRPPVDARLDHIRGRRDAPLALVEYGDYACPHTSAAAAAVERARARHGERLRYVFRHLPLEDAHPHAPLAAEAAQAAGAQGRFWELHDRLMAADGDLDPGELVDHARALGLDLERFGEDLRHHVHAPAVQADLDSARRSGARGTPTFYVEGGARSPAAGPLTLEQALAALDDATRGAGSTSTS